MKRAPLLFWAALLPLMPTSSSANYSIDNINYASLAQDLWTDHVRAFRCLFAVQPISSFLDFGTGKGTKYFLDHCDHVTSCELSTTSRNMTEWYEASLRAYAHYKNWSPYHVFNSANFNFFNEDGQTYHDVNLINSERYTEYLLEVKSICDMLLSKRQYDVAFIDPGMVSRADFVNYLFGKIDIIAAHDTHDPIYGWERIRDDVDYEKILFSRGCGVIFWIKKTRENLIHALREEIALHMEDFP
jgi:hypothetical protein